MLQAPQRLLAAQQRSLGALSRGAVSRSKTAIVMDRFPQLQSMQTEARKWHMWVPKHALAYLPIDAAARQGQAAVLAIMPLRQFHAQLRVQVLHLATHQVLAMVAGGCQHMPNWQLQGSAFKVTSWSLLQAWTCPHPGCACILAAPASWLRLHPGCACILAAPASWLRLVVHILPTPPAP
jgi:hypothetical protein